MKNYKIVLKLVLVSVVLLLNCNPDGEPEGPTDKELAFEKLAGEWGYGTGGGIILDGEDVSVNYPDFSLSFTDGTYQTQSGGKLFKSTGTWRWADETAGSILLDTGEVVTIAALSETALDFTFTHTSSGGTAAGLSGSYRVKLDR